eukprot:jgi/Botrbrau1/9489/Bobra.0252s0104.1
MMCPVGAGIWDRGLPSGAGCFHHDLPRGAGKLDHDLPSEAWTVDQELTREESANYGYSSKDYERGSYDDEGTGGMGPTMMPPRGAECDRLPWDLNLRLSPAGVVLHSTQGHAEDEALFDTVGTITVDHEGRVCAGVSSGGIALKVDGRVGEAAIYGCGCWAYNAPPGDLGPSVACSVTGMGETIMRAGLARELCERIRRDPSGGLPGTCTAVLRERILSQTWCPTDCGAIVVVVEWSPAGPGPLEGSGSPDRMPGRSSAEPCAPDRQGLQTEHLSSEKRRRLCSGNGPPGRACASAPDVAVSRNGIESSGHASGLEPSDKGLSEGLSKGLFKGKERLCGRGNPAASEVGSALGCSLVDAPVPVEDAEKQSKGSQRERERDGSEVCVQARRTPEERPGGRAEEAGAGEVVGGERLLTEQGEGREAGVRYRKAAGEEMDRQFLTVHFAAVHCSESLGFAYLCGPGMQKPVSRILRRRPEDSNPFAVHTWGHSLAVRPTPSTCT